MLTRSEKHCLSDLADKYYVFGTNGHDRASVTEYFDKINYANVY